MLSKIDVSRSLAFYDQMCYFLVRYSRLFLLVKDVIVLRRLSHILVVAITLFATAAPCFCWVQMLSKPSCHASQMKDCCCSKEAKINDTASQHQAAVLPSVLPLPELQPAVLGVDYSDVVFSSHFPAFGSRGIGMPLRSPPDLYLVHAVFRI